MRKKGLILILVSYLLCFILGYILFIALPLDKILNLLIIDIILTIIIFILSTIFKNSSFYDPYWSVIPLFFTIYYFIYKSNITPLSILLLIVIALWSIRLTVNWVYTFKGLDKEDFRYINYRKYKLFPLINFFGIHLFPTAIVFLLMLPIFYLLNNNVLSPFSLCGFLIALIGIALEIISDITMHKHRNDELNKSKICREGIYNIVRHPNYLGEITFWLGVYFMFLYENYSYYYLIIGPILNALMFIFISIPLMEKHIKNKDGYNEYIQEVGSLLPKLSLKKK